MSISTTLQKKLQNLNEEERKIFDRIFDVSYSYGAIKPPKEMEPWLKKNFQEIKKTTSQKIIRIDNKITFEGTLYNDLRLSRPMSIPEDGDLEKIIRENEGDPFCTPEKSTPADSFGRIYGKHCISASNVAKYEGMHGLIVFNTHHPLCFDEEMIEDYLKTSLRWFRLAHKDNSKAIYPLLIWNCLWPSGGSQIHGHIQLTLTENRPYQKISLLNDQGKNYRRKFQSDYHEDFIDISERLDLSEKSEEGSVVVNLTPVKEKEIMIFPENKMKDKTSDDKDLAKKSGTLIHRALQCYKEIFGVQSFNLVMFSPPLEKRNDYILPTFIRIIQRGSITTKTNDIASMEIFAQSVVGSNPFSVAEKLFTCRPEVGEKTCR